MPALDLDRLKQVYTFVFLSTTDWDAPQFGSRQQIALRLAQRGHRVLFVEVPRALHSLISDPQATRQALGRLGKVRPPDGFLDLAPQLQVFTPQPVLPIYYHPATNAVNQALLARNLRQTLGRLGWHPDVLWTYWANSARMVGHLGERVAVYHCIDDFTAIHYPLVEPGVIAAMEADLCRSVDLVLARTAELAEDKRRHNPNTVYLPGGVDPALFDPTRLYAEPTVLAHLPHPRVGFLGTVDDRVDVDLLAAAARQLPNVSFVIVGPRKRHLVDLTKLQNLPNVNLLPACPPSAVPTYIAGFDVCLIPYRVTPYTRGLSPLKLYEYLAMGKPVVATDLPYVAREADKIYLVHTPEEFAAAIASALSEPSNPNVKDCRRTAAVAFSWDAQVDTIEAHLTRLLDTQP